MVHEVESSETMFRNLEVESQETKMEASDEISTNFEREQHEFELEISDAIKRNLQTERYETQLETGDQISSDLESERRGTEIDVGDEITRTLVTENADLESERLNIQTEVSDDITKYSEPERQECERATTDEMLTDLEQTEVTPSSNLRAEAEEDRHETERTGDMEKAAEDLVFHQETVETFADISQTSTRLIHYGGPTSESGGVESTHDTCANVCHGKNIYIYIRYSS